MTAATNTKGVLPSLETLELARAEIIDSLPSNGIGLKNIERHLDEDIAPGLNDNSQSANYYGFVTGGATEAARYADNFVTVHDQNVQVHLPNETVSTNVEDAALRMLCQLVDLNDHTQAEQSDHSSPWEHRTFTTGATASNVLGLACGREFVVQEAARRLGKSASTAEDGLCAAMQIAGLDEIQVLTTVAHSSLRKAASIVGLGRSCVKDVGREDAPHVIDLQKLVAEISRPRTATIVTVSCAEVNTGLFATDAALMRDIRKVCSQHGGWLHVDAAFGLLARVLPDSDGYRVVKDGTACIELADSITGDAHKLINVPYDCGIFLSKQLFTATQVFQNPNAAYLSTASSETTASREQAIASPLNIGIENSRRFRALPVYATLVAYGQRGYREMLVRQIQLARGIARFLAETPGFELLPPSDMALEKRLESIYIVVLFRASDESINNELKDRINQTRRIYLSGTQWEGRAATRFAIANWQVDVERDLRLVTEVLLGALGR